MRAAFRRSSSVVVLGSAEAGGTKDGVGGMAGLVAVGVRRPGATDDVVVRPAQAARPIAADAAANPPRN